MKKIYLSIVWLTCSLLFSTAIADDELELNTSFVKGNKELPQMLYIVPWQDMKTKKGKKAAQNLTLHSLFGDIFEPVLPTE